MNWEDKLTDLIDAYERYKNILDQDPEENSLAVAHLRDEYIEMRSEILNRLERRDS